MERFITINMHRGKRVQQNGRGGRASCLLQFEGTVLLVLCMLVTNLVWFGYLFKKSGKDPMLDPHYALLSLHRNQIADQRVNEKVLFAFTIRDALRLVPVEPAEGVHVFDYVDVYHESQGDLYSAQLYLDGRYAAEPPCVAYSIECYRDKMMQVFPHALNVSQAEYFFYMESDNTLCVPLKEIEQLALRHKRYFLGSGVGASGWLMQRQFMIDFIKEAERMKELNKNFYAKEQRNMPDMVASNILMKKLKWSVTNRYLVSHTIQDSKGTNALTQAHPGNTKHLPRCLEPHRGKWTKRGETADQFGWDYFDYEKCPHAEVYPCHDDDEVKRPFVISELDDTSTKPPILVSNVKKISTGVVHKKDMHVSDNRFVDFSMQ